MTSYLIISEKREATQDKVTGLCQERNISPFDATIFDLKDLETKSGPKKSWGIQDIKELQKKIYLKPLKGEWKALILYDAHLLTTEAQNALLKLLEEPPNGTIFILVSNSFSDLLPTVRSRCSIYTLDEKPDLSLSERESIIEELRDLTDATIGERLKKAEMLSKSKESAMVWLKKALLSGHDALSEEPSGQSAEIMRTLHKSYLTIKASNVPIRLVLENLFLGLK